MNRKNMQGYQLMRGDPYLRFWNKDQHIRRHKSSNLEIYVKRAFLGFVTADWFKTVGNYIKEDLKRWATTN